MIYIGSDLHARHFSMCVGAAAADKVSCRMQGNQEELPAFAASILRLIIRAVWHGDGNIVLVRSHPNGPWSGQSPYWPGRCQRAFALHVQPRALEARTTM